MEYNIKCSNARLWDAIGIYYHVSLNITADSLDQALDKFCEIYTHNSPCMYNGDYYNKRKDKWINVTSEIK